MNKTLRTTLLGLMATCGTAAWAQAVGDIIEVDGNDYQVKGENIIVNGSFDDGVTGWFAGAWADADASNYTLATEGGFDGGAYLQYSAGGVNAATNIRSKWAVENGKMYLFRCYTSGTAPTSANLQYSKLRVYDESKDNMEGADLYQLKWGASDVWTLNDFVFTATFDMVTFRSSWTTNTKLDGFGLYEVERYYSPEGFNKAMEAAQAALDNADYANVTGNERAALAAAIEQYTGATADKYEEAINALDAAVKTFTAAKADYDAFATAQEAASTLPELPYALAEKRPSVANLAVTTAAEAKEQAAAIYTAIRAYYESNALAEGVEGAVNMTDKLTNYKDPTNTNGWTFTAGNIRIMSSEPYTDADGTATHSYFDSNSWNKAFATKFTQSVDLAPGKYILTAKSRGNSIVTYQVIGNGQSTDMPVSGSTGGVFGRGWNDYTVEFDVTKEDGAVELGINVETTDQGNWISFSDFRLVQLEKDNTVEYATAEDIEALNQKAFAVAADHEEGFAAGQYAPYTNVEAFTALSKVIDLLDRAKQGEDVTKAAVDEASASLDNLTWTANTEEMNAIFDGKFAATEANETSGDITLPGWTKVQGIRLLVKDETVDPGLAYTDGKAAVFAWGGTTLTYGEQTGYTLPLDVEKAYKLSFKVSGWRDGDLPSDIRVKLTGCDEEVINYAKVAPINSTEGNPFAALELGFKGFTASPVLTIYANHHFTIADLELKSITEEEYEIVTGISEAPVAKTAADQAIYNLAGQRVQKTGKGLYIIGGKKVIK